MSDQNELTQGGEVVQQQDAANLAQLPENHPVLESLRASREDWKREREQRQAAEAKATEAAKFAQELEQKLSRKHNRPQDAAAVDPDSQQKLENYEQLQSRVKELEANAKANEARERKGRIKAAAVDAFQKAGAHDPSDFFKLEAENFALRDDGSVYAYDGGVEREPSAYIESLKSSRAYMFRSSGAQGMGASTSTPSSVPGGKSFKEMNFTERLQMEVDQPELFRRLKAQSGD